MVLMRKDHILIEGLNLVPQNLGISESPPSFQHGSHNKFRNFLSDTLTGPTFFRVVPSSDSQDYSEKIQGGNVDVELLHLLLGFEVS